MSDFPDCGPTSANESSSGAERRSGKRVNNSKSCDFCRRRHHKCDGRIGTVYFSPKDCSNCQKRGHRCEWEGQLDRRLPVPHDLFLSQSAMIKNLQDQVKGLQQSLVDNGISEDVRSSENQSFARRRSSGTQSDEDELAESFGRIVLEDNKWTFYGGPSPFRNLQAPEARKHIADARFQEPVMSFEEDICATHVLQTPFNVGHQRCPTTHDWLRFLPPDAVILLSRVEHDTVLDTFFRFYSSWSSRIIPQLFLRELYIATSTKLGPAVQTNHYSGFLHNAILSVALAYSANFNLRSREVRDKFAQHAKTFLETECQRPTLSTVQSLGLLSSYHSGFSEQGLGFLYFGMSARTCQALGLHIRVPEGLISKEGRIERNTLFWSTFIQDKCWSFFVGRDQALNPPNGEIPEPQIDTDLDQTNFEWYTMDRTSITSQSSYISSSFAKMVALMRIAPKIMAAVYAMNGASRKGIQSDLIINIYHELRTWERDLPLPLRIEAPTRCSSPPHIFILNLVFEWLLLLLLRPLYNPRGKWSSTPSVIVGNLTRQLELRHELRRISLNECPKTASRIVALLSAYHTTYSLRLSPITIVQITFVAAKVHLSTMSARDQVPTWDSKAAEAEAHVRSCIGFLHEIGETWSSGTVTANILSDALARCEEELRRTKYTPPRHPPPQQFHSSPSGAETILVSQSFDDHNPVLTSPFVFVPSSFGDDGNGGPASSITPQTAGRLDNTCQLENMPLRPFPVPPMPAFENQPASPVTIPQSRATLTAHEQSEMVLEPDDYILPEWELQWMHSGDRMPDQPISASHPTAHPVYGNLEKGDALKEALAPAGAFDSPLDSSTFHL